MGSKLAATMFSNLSPKHFLDQLISTVFVFLDSNGDYGEDTECGGGYKQARLGFSLGGASEWVDPVWESSSRVSGDQAACVPEILLRQLCRLAGHPVQRQPAKPGCKVRFPLVSFFGLKECLKDGCVEYKLKQKVFIRGKFKTLKMRLRV